MMKANSALCLALLWLAILAPCQAAEPDSKSPSLVQKVGNAVERGASAAAGGVQRGVKAAARGVERAASATARGVKAAANGTARGASAAAHGVQSAAAKITSSSTAASSAGK